MGDGNEVGRPNGVVIDRVVARALHVVRDDPTGMEAFLRAYFVHVDADDLARRTPEDLFGMAAEHAQQGSAWQPGTASVRVLSPLLEVDGWESPHSVLLTVTDDLPFLVDSVTMELTRLGVGIHLVVHPVLRDERSTGGSFDAGGDGSTGPPASFIAIEIDRQADPAGLEAIEQGVRRVLGDVRRSVEDWPTMRDRMLEIAEDLDASELPVAESEVAESRELLRWLADDHFIFLGYREYALEGDELVAVADSGLGILRAAPAVLRRQLADMPPQTRARAQELRLLNVTKAGSRSTIHRASYLDYVGVKTFDSGGAVTGERRFIGLYTAEVYTRSVTRIPRVRGLVEEVLARAGYPAGGHDEKRLLNILEDYPRDELLQIDVDELFATALTIAGLQERRRVQVFARAELFGRFVTCMVYIPRDRYNTKSRTAIQDLLTAAYGGSTSDWSTQITESVLARLLIHVRVESGDPKPVDTSEIATQVEEILRDWEDDFRAELVRELGEDVAVGLSNRYSKAFPQSYRDSFSPRVAVTDLRELEKLVSEDDMRLNAYRNPGQPTTAFKLKLYRRGDRVSLTSIMPSLTNLGVIVVDEQPYEIRRDDQAPLWIYEFAIEHLDPFLEFAEVAALVEETLTAVWRGDVEDDGFNRLVLAAGISPRDVVLLRAYTRYLHQARSAYSQDYIEQTLRQHPRAARLLIDLFMARFDPALENRDARADEIGAAFGAMVDAITSLDQDRILRRFHNLIVCTLRTNFFQRADDGGHPPYLAFKLDPQGIDELPEPRPRFEIFAYSPRFEGVHLRSGRVARGGLRWSDRNEDFRTEVLGLVKAQMVKNAVIVPSGAKGGFVLKRPPTDDDPTTLRAEVVACYRLFISALLDLTDNLVGADVVPPAHMVRHDDDDTYLVVAADKGTATFSDIANELAVARSFWLGDAFASGGSNGYDHKGMGITARGAWESVKRHFRELGVDIQSEPFTVVGVGDMSGDVFGNGMLLSEQIRLVAAFDHRHVFLDPDPDPASSYVERRRLFGLPTSSWADYDTALLSAGGGVYERSAKSIELSREACEALDIDRAELTPAELMTAILRAPVDLVWNGGIGTYVKASAESHADAGDKANDAIRVNASDLRARVVGEGGNLGVTQRARVEFARADGYINTDAIDNAGGVDCSDHEVNIKIALNLAVAEGDLTEKQRNELLAAMADDVAALVLANNRRQTQAISAERVEAASMVDVHARYLSALASEGRLDRELECLPDSDAMADRRLAEEGLSSPEIAVLMAYAKNVLNEQLLASPLPDDPVFEPLLVDYFPAVLHEQWGEAIKRHRLRREIVANRLANLVVDRAGITMVYRLSQETSAAAAEIVAAHMAAWAIFELDELSEAVNAMNGTIPALAQLGIHLSARQLAERAARQLIRTRPFPFRAAQALADLAAPVQQIVGRMPQYLLGADLAAYEAQLTDLLETGMPKKLAERVAAMTPSLSAIEIVEVARERGVEPTIVAAVHFEMADRLELNWLRGRILGLPRDSQWSSLARLTLRADLYADHRALTSQAVGHNHDIDPHELVERWLHENASAAGHYRRTISDIRAAGPTDITTLLVAAREVRNLIDRTTPVSGAGA